MPDSKPVRALRDLAGIALLEANRYPEHYQLPKEEAKYASEVDRVSNELFGFTSGDTCYRFSNMFENFAAEHFYDAGWLPDEVLAKAPAEILAEYEHFKKWEQNFAIVDASGYEIEEEEVIKIFEFNGWNVSDGEGNLLDVFDLFARQIIVKISNLALPASYVEAEPLDVEKWGAKFAAEAAAFRSKRRS